VKRFRWWPNGVIYKISTASSIKLAGFRKLLMNWIFPRKCWIIIFKSCALRSSSGLISIRIWIAKWVCCGSSLRKARNCMKMIIKILKSQGICNSDTDYRKIKSKIVWNIQGIMKIIHHRCCLSFKEKRINFLGIWSNSLRLWHRWIFQTLLGLMLIKRCFS